MVYCPKYLEVGLMSDSCDHYVFVLGNKAFRASQADETLKEFAQTVADFNIRGVCQQINHPGYLSSVSFCMDCGQPVDFKPDWGRHYKDAVESFDCRGSSKLEAIKAKELTWSDKAG